MLKWARVEAFSLMLMPVYFVWKDRLCFCYKSHEDSDLRWNSDDQEEADVLSPELSIKALL